jgi:hypothetical protein
METRLKTVRWNHTGTEAPIPDPAATGSGIADLQTTDAGANTSIARTSRG